MTTLRSLEEIHDDLVRRSQKMADDDNMFFREPDKYLSVEFPYFRWVGFYLLRSAIRIASPEANSFNLKIFRPVGPSFLTLHSDKSSVGIFKDTSHVDWHGKFIPDPNPNLTGGMDWSPGKFSVYQIITGSHC